jgi:hypothetical protein
VVELGQVKREGVARDAHTVRDPSRGESLGALLDEEPEDREARVLGEGAQCRDDVR